MRDWLYSRFWAFFAKWQVVMALFAVIAGLAIWRAALDLGFTAGLMGAVMPLALAEDERCPKVVFIVGEACTCAFLVYMIVEMSREGQLLGAAAYLAFLIMSMLLFWEFWKQRFREPQRLPVP
jgi:hypothetical protein